MKETSPGHANLHRGVTTTNFIQTKYTRRHANMLLAGVFRHGFVFVHKKSELST
jgi:hypothetical protein